MIITFEQLQELISKHKYVFFGEVHGTKEIPQFVGRLLANRSNAVLCAEFAVEAMPNVEKFLKTEITQEQLLNTKSLQEAIRDKRVSTNILSLWKELSLNNIKIQALEDYNVSFTCAIDRDKMMANRFTSIANRNSEKSCFIYAGGAHLLDDELSLGQFTVTPLKIFLPKETKEQALTIQFKKGEIRIIHDSSKNLVTCFLPYKIF